MRAEVRKILDPSRGVVFFSCESGSAPGRWMGESPPRLGLCYVEIEVPDEIEEWTVAASNATGLYGDSESGSDVRVECEVLRFDDSDDSVVEVRLGSDIVMIEILNRRSDLSVGALISCRVPEIQLYPYIL